MSTQEEAIRKVGEAFATDPGSGMTPEQQAAFKRVQDAFRPADQIISSPQQPLQLGIVDPNDTNAFRSTQAIMDASPESTLAGFESQRQQFLQTQQQEMGTLRSERRTLAEQQAGAMEGFSQEEIIRREREALGMQTMIDEQMAIINEIRGLRSQYIDLEQQKGDALALSDGRVAPIGFIRGEQARIAEQFDRRQAVVSARMGAETAHLQAISGMVQQARGLISDIVNAATFDTELELKRIQIFRDVNAQEIAELDRDIQNQLQESQRYWENRLNMERQEKSQVMELMLQAPGAGITINDTVEQAVQKAQSFIGSQPATSRTLTYWEAKDLGVPFGTTEAEARGLMPGGGSSTSGIEFSFTGAKRDRILASGVPLQSVSRLEQMINDYPDIPLEYVLADESLGLTAEQIARVGEVLGGGGSSDPLGMDFTQFSALETPTTEGQNWWKGLLDKFKFWK